MPNSKVPRLKKRDLSSRVFEREYQAGNKQTTRMQERILNACFKELVFAEEGMILASVE